jgi:glycerophosphoryl diester phosphodiesterase
MENKTISNERQIFISYRRVGGEAMAYLLKEKLIANGYPTFLDIHSLESGRFNEALYKNIDECSDIIIILSPGALDRCEQSDDWLRLEICHALSRSKNLIPVFLNGFQWPDTLHEDIEPLKIYNGPAEVNFQLFQSFIEKLIAMLSCNKRKKIATRTAKDRSLQVLVWSDFDTGILKKLVKKLDSKYEYIIMADPLEITHYDLHSIYAVILLNTDVTKLSSSEETRLILDQLLSDFIEAGGLLLGSHDIIYRRTKNILLQKAFGCTIKNFMGMDRVEYQKTDECKELNMFLSLDDNFYLMDGEVCWGDLAPDATVYFVYEDKQSGDIIPLVFGRDYGDGHCFWINSGEYKEHPPQSISKAETSLVLLMNEILNMETV